MLSLYEILWEMCRTTRSNSNAHSVPDMGQPCLTPCSNSTTYFSLPPNLTKAVECRYKKRRACKNMLGTPMAFKTPNR